MPVKTKKWITIGVVVGFMVIALALLGVLLLGREESQPTGNNNATKTETTNTTVVETTLEAPVANVFTPMDFGYEGDYLTCLTDESIMGIDVSIHQQEIDFAKVKEAGVEFVMIRLGYRGFVEGLLFEDKWAQINYQGAKAAGLKVGGYFFSQAICVEEAVEEAQYAMEIIKDWELEMPLVYDWEFVREDYRTANMDARGLTDCTLAFCRTVEEAGYDAMVYFNPEQSRKKMYLQELTDYKFWLAMYTDEMVYPYKVDMWQYTCTGSVPGINGNVDINLYFPYPRENFPEPEQ